MSRTLIEEAHLDPYYVTWRFAGSDSVFYHWAPFGEHTYREVRKFLTEYLGHPIEMQEEA